MTSKKNNLLPGEKKKNLKYYCPQLINYRKYANIWFKIIFKIKINVNIT